jgi:hypothetical protein
VKLERFLLGRPRDLQDRKIFHRISLIPFLAWVGMGAGLLPRRVTGRAEIRMLAVYGVVAAYAFGLLLNLSSWPFVLGIAVPAELATVPVIGGEAEVGVIRAAEGLADRS